jgi:hypothetical protein
MSTETDRDPRPRITNRWTEPVTIDDQGRIFRADGTQPIVPGLEPEKVLNGLADFDAGRSTLIEAEMREEFLAKFHALFEADS